MDPYNNSRPFNDGNNPRRLGTSSVPNKPIALRLVDPDYESGGKSSVPNNPIALRPADPDYERRGTQGEDASKRVQKYPETF